MAEWQTLTQVPIGVKLQSTIDALSDVLDALTTALQVVTSALEILQAFALASLNLIKSIVDAIIALIEELLFDLLEFNVAMAFHVNLNWNPYWVHDKEKERDPRTGRLDPRLIDFENDGQLPWSGTGLVGWILDHIASVKDPTDPFRPISDDSTAVYGVTIIKGIADPALVENGPLVQEWIDLFTNWKGLAIDFSVVRTNEYFDSLAKLGTTSAIDTLASLYRLGPKSRQLLGVQEFVNSQISDFFPSPGAYPKWVSAPMAALVPPLAGAIEDLRKMLGLLRFSDDASSALSKLIDTIQSKLATLEEGIAQVEDALALLAGLAAFPTDSYIIVHKRNDGGMEQWLGDILAADSAPNFGTAGIVVGITLVATLPDAQVAIDKFLEIVGIKTSAYLSGTTAMGEALDETFADLFP